jgi:hypothetical protein
MFTIVPPRRLAVACAAVLLAWATPFRVHGDSGAPYPKAGAAPALLLSTYLGGAGGDSLTSVATDRFGNTYVSGYGSLAPIPVEHETRIGPGLDNPFVAKLLPDGSVAFLTRIGGSSNEGIGELAVDAAGNVYVSGVTDSEDFPHANWPDGSEAFEPLSFFVAKLTPDGSALAYTAFFGTDRGAAWPTRLAVTPAGAAVFVGTTEAPDFPTVNALDPTLSGSSDAFLVKIDSDGSRLVYATFLGGEGREVVLDVDVDAIGSVYVTGSTSDGSTFPVVTPAAPDLTDLSTDAFIAKLNPEGSAIVYASVLGGQRTDTGNAIVVDARGSAYVGGFAGRNFRPRAESSPSNPTLTGRTS